jgi:tRNA-splicing ligase RtcB
MKRWFVNLPDRDLAYLSEGSTYFDDYLEAVGWAQEYARTNRDVMLARTVEAVAAALGRPVVATTEAVNCHHNYVARERHYGSNLLVTRKGAVRAGPCRARRPRSATPSPIRSAPRRGSSAGRTRG